MAILPFLPSAQAKLLPDRPPMTIAQMPENTGSYSPRVIQRDYQINRPLPMTDRTTIVDLIDNLNPSRMFDQCPENSQLIEFAESTN